MRELTSEQKAENIDRAFDALFLESKRKQKRERQMREYSEVYKKAKSFL